MFIYIPSNKVRNKTEEALFGIPGASTQPNNALRVKPFVEIDIVFLLETD